MKWNAKQEVPVTAVSSNKVIRNLRTYTVPLRANFKKILRKPFFVFVLIFTKQVFYLSFFYTSYMGFDSLLATFHINCKRCFKIISRWFNSILKFLSRLRKLKIKRFLNITIAHIKFMTAHFNHDDPLE